MSAFVREFGLINNGSNPQWFAKSVRWEPRWVAQPATLSDATSGYEELHLVPVVRQWEMLFVSGRWTPVLTRITEQSPRRHVPGPAGDEPEELRRARIRAIREAIHVDPKPGFEEPRWCGPSVNIAA